MTTRTILPFLLLGVETRHTRNPRWVPRVRRGGFGWRAYLYDGGERERARIFGTAHADRRFSSHGRRRGGTRETKRKRSMETKPNGPARLASLCIISIIALCGSSEKKGLGEHLSVHPNASPSHLHSTVKPCSSDELAPLLSVVMCASFWLPLANIEWLDRFRSIIT